MTENNVEKVVIIGSGLVGSLCACFMAKRGYQVHVYEYREDIRKSELVKGRSINLALSNRGRKSLKFVGLEDEVLKEAIPMQGRLLHSLSGKLKSVAYDTRTKQCIYSVSRNFLNSTLLTAAEKYPNVKIHFNHKLTDVDFDEGTVTFVKVITQERIKVEGDFIIGADGAFSTLRRSMQNTPLFEFSQTYIKHGYLELSIPSSRGGKTNMTPNHLHIWPRGDFMMIALPNLNESWTVTLFMPFKIFETLSTPEDLLSFFRNTFPDSLKLLGEKELIKDFFKVKPSHLVSIKCNPYQVGDKFLLIGDAAHAMVPFYGQGMNAGFEDCYILNEILDKNHGDIVSSIKEYSRKRKGDAYSICDLAMYNYEEMRDLVTRPSYKLRKILDDCLFKLLGSYWIPLYNSVTFSDIGYSKCIENRRRQNKIIHTGLAICTLLLSGISTVCVYYNFFY